MMLATSTHTRLPAVLLSVQVSVKSMAEVDGAGVLSISHPCTAVRFSSVGSISTDEWMVMLWVVLPQVVLHWVSRSGQPAISMVSVMGVTTGCGL